MGSADVTAKPYYRWLRVAAKFEVRRKAGRIHVPLDEMAVYHHLAMIARAQFALDLSFDRLKDAQVEFALATGDPLRENEAMLRAFLEAHAFLVSAALFWNSVTTLARHFALPELDEAIEESAVSIKQAKTARHHVEHVSERIERGRTERFGDAMSAEDFREAVSSIQGDEVIFGSERFDLREILASTHRVAEAVAPTMDEGMRVTFRSRS